MKINLTSVIIGGIIIGGAYWLYKKNQKSSETGTNKSGFLGNGLGGPKKQAYKDGDRIGNDCWHARTNSWGPCAMNKPNAVINRAIR